MTTYLDHNATTPLHPEVLEAMLPFLQGTFGNASSTHAPGRGARTALDRARAQVAALVGVESPQVLFTSGGTEADNLAVLGTTAAMPPAGIAISAIEHPAVLEPARVLQRRGWRLDEVAVDGTGRVTVASLDDALGADTRLVSIMLANNETGVIQPLAELAERARARGALVHTDAVQAAGKLAIDFNALGVDLMSLSAHKLNGPQGVGALILAPGVELAPLQLGGGQERGLRSGTMNLAGIVGFGRAAELATAELARRATVAAGLRDAFETRLTGLPGVELFADGAPRLPNTTLFALHGFSGESLVMTLDAEGLAVSSGSACHSGLHQPSHVLTAMAVPAERALGAVRVSFGLGNGPADVERLIAALEKISSRLPSSVVLAASV